VFFYRLKPAVLHAIDFFTTSQAYPNPMLAHLVCIKMGLSLAAGCALLTQTTIQSNAKPFTENHLRCSSFARGPAGMTNAPATAGKEMILMGTRGNG
jgi:hypothetical protein